MNNIRIYLRLLRPKHWIKNLLVFAPLFFVGQFFSIPDIARGILLFVTFSFLASSVYVINDLVDKKEDALHPQKKERPIASGKIKTKEAIIIVIVLLLTTFLFSLRFTWETDVILLSYFILNILYSLYFKHLPLVDIFVVTVMYLIRIFAGGTLYGIFISHWLILCTFFLSLFLIIAKRRAEFCYFNGKEFNTRKVLTLYNKDFLDHLLTITTTATLVSYSLYALSIEKPYLVYSIIIVAFGIFRYLYSIYRFNAGESPETIIFKDKILFSTILMWGLYMTIIFYLY